MIFSNSFNGDEARIESRSSAFAFRNACDHAVCGQAPKFMLHCQDFCCICLGTFMGVLKKSYSEAG